MLVDCHMLWILRKGEIHDMEKQQKWTKQLEQLERDLVEIYKYHTEVLAADRDLFDTFIEDLLTMQPGNITKWIVSQKPIILQSRQEVNGQNLNYVRLLHTYFHPLACRHKAKKPHPKRLTPPLPTTSSIAPLITEYFRRSKAPILCHCCTVLSTHLLIQPKLTQQAIQFPDDVI
jgi:hypothetical protein